MSIPTLPYTGSIVQTIIARRSLVSFQRLIFVAMYFILPLPECDAQQTLLDSSVVFNRSLPADTTETPRPNSLREGAWAVMLQVSTAVFSTQSFPGLDSFYSGYVFGKHHITAQDAVRGGLLVGLFSEIGQGDKRSQQQFGLALQYVRYAKPEAVVHFFYGGGVFYTSQASKYDYKSPNQSDSEFLSLFFGISGFLGVEWFATKHLSLHGEFGGNIGVVYERETRLDPRFNGTFSDGAYYELELLPLKLGASIYF